MTAEAAPSVLARYWAPLSILALGTVLLGYEFATDGVSGAMHHMGVNLDGMARLLNQIDGGQWDPEDPDDFKKMVRMLIALGFSTLTIASLTKVQPAEVEGWQRGEAPKKQQWEIVAPLIRAMRKITQGK